MAVNGKRTPRGDVNRILSGWDNPANRTRNSKDLQNTILSNLSEWDDNAPSTSDTPTLLTPTDKKESKKKTTKRKPHTKPSTRKTKTQSRSNPATKKDANSSELASLADDAPVNELHEDVLEESISEPVIQSASSTIVDEPSTYDTDSSDDDTFGGGFIDFSTNDDPDYERIPARGSELLADDFKHPVLQDDEMPDLDDYASIWDNISKDPESFAAKVMSNDVDHTETSTGESNDNNAIVSDDGVQTDDASTPAITLHQDADGNEVLDLSILDDDYVDDQDQDSLTSSISDTLDSNPSSMNASGFNNALQSMMGPLQQRLNQNASNSFTEPTITSSDDPIDNAEDSDLGSPIIPLASAKPNSSLTFNNVEPTGGLRTSNYNGDKIRHTTDNKDALEDLFDSYEQDLSEIEEMRKKTEAEKERNRRPLGKIKRAHEAAIRKHHGQMSNETSSALTGYDPANTNDTLNEHDPDPGQSNETMNVAGNVNPTSSISTPTESSYSTTNGSDGSYMDYMDGNTTDNAMSIPEPIRNAYDDPNDRDWGLNQNQDWSDDFTGRDSAGGFDSYQSQQLNGVAHQGYSPSIAIPLSDNTMGSSDSNDHNANPQLQVDDGSWDNAEPSWNVTNDNEVNLQSSGDGDNSFDQYNSTQFGSGIASAIASSPAGVTDGVPMSYEDDAEWANGGHQDFGNSSDDIHQSPEDYDQHSMGFDFEGNPFASPDDDDAMIPLGDGVLDSIDEGDSFDLGRDVDDDTPEVEPSNEDEETGAAKSLGGRKKKKGSSKSKKNDNGNESHSNDSDDETPSGNGIGSLFKSGGTIKGKIIALMAQMKSEFHGGDGSSSDADPTDTQPKTPLSKSKDSSKDAESDDTPKEKKPRKSPKEVMNGVAAAVKNPKQLISTVRSAFKTAKKTTWILITISTLVIGVWGGSNIPAITNKGGVTEEAVDEGSVSLVGTSWSDGKAKITMRNDSEMIAHVSGSAEVRSWAPTFNPATWLTARVTASCTVPSVEVDPGAEKTVDAECGKTTGVWHRIRAKLSYE